MFFSFRLSCRVMIVTLIVEQHSRKIGKYENIYATMKLKLDKAENNICEAMVQAAPRFLIFKK